MIRPAVLEAFVPFTARFEGHTRGFYLCAAGDVTMGYGDNVDPISLAFDPDIEYERSPGVPATTSEVSADWLKVKNRQDIRGAGWGAFGPLTKVRATEASIRRLVDRKLHEFAAYLCLLFPGWSDWPADAQLGTLSMCWALGPGKLTEAKYPHFVAYCRAGDFANAALECHMSEVKNKQIAPRNVANADLFRCAATAEDPAELSYPGDTRPA